MIGRRAIARLLLKGDRSSCDGTFFLKVNRCKLSLYENAQRSFHQVDWFRKYAGYATAFVKHAGYAHVFRSCAKTLLARFTNQAEKEKADAQAGYRPPNMLGDITFLHSISIRIR